MKGRLKKSQRTFRDLFFFHVFKLDEDELLNTAQTIFILSITLLFISAILTTALVLVGVLPVVKHAKTILHTLDNYSLYSFFFLVLSTLLSVWIKAGSFEKHRAHLIWFSFMLIVASIVMLSFLLVSLVRRQPWGL